MSVIVLASLFETPLCDRETQAGPGPWWRHMVCWGDRRHQSVWDITEARDRRREETSLDITRPEYCEDQNTTEAYTSDHYCSDEHVLCDGMWGALERERRQH